MEWLINIDIALLRFINVSVKSDVLDATMPFFSGNRFFMPMAVICCLLVLLRWKWRGLICLALVGLGLAIGDGFIYPNLKAAIGRLRPYESLSDVVVLVGTSKSWSMPSSHAANWFCVATILFAFFRRSLWITLPIALLVSFSRVYTGAHYPGDVLSGALLGAGCGAAVLWTLSWAWIRIGQAWFPLWWEKHPSLIAGRSAELEQEDEEPQYRPRGSGGAAPARHATVDDHWVRLGYIFIVVTCVARLFYLASGTMQLSPDEAYQWHWSRHLDLSYFSKPPLIAYTQWLGTTIWGNNEFGVRFFSPLIAALIGVLLLRFFAREFNARAGFVLLVMLSTTPMVAGGAVLMTVDPLSVLFWTAAMLAGWKAVRDRSPTSSWLWFGLWMGLGFLSKYTALFQWLSLAVFFLLWAPARKQLARPGPYLALVACALCALPVLVWNYQHDWVTVGHVAEDAGAGKAWKPTLKYFLEFIGGEFAILNPVYFVGVAWAGVAMWKRNRHNPLLVYFFSMGAPLLLIYLLFSFKSRVLLNWIAPAVIPLFCLAVVYWDTRLRLGVQQVKTWLTVGISLGAVAVIVGHDTDLTTKLLKVKLPPKYDPMRRVRGWPETAKVVDNARKKLQTEGEPVFIIGDHYGITSQVSFYLPGARELAGTGDPMVYCISSPKPQNQFHLWPGYEHKTGQNAVFVRELSLRYKQPPPAPPRLSKEFETVEEVRIYPVIRRHDREPTRYLQVFFCRGLR
jgi:membrane-associated phospholipid phosphatase